MRKIENTVRIAVDQAHTDYDGNGSIEEIKADVPLEKEPTVAEICRIDEEEVHDPKGRVPDQSRMYRDVGQVTEGRSEGRAVVPKETRRKNLWVDKTHWVLSTQRRASSGKRPDLGNSPVRVEDGVVCTLTYVHYMVDGSVGIRPEWKNANCFAVDTGDWFNIIRRGAKQPGWDVEVDYDAISPRISDANGNQLSLRESVWLTVRFGNTKFKFKFIVAERIAVDVIIGT